MFAVIAFSTFGCAERVGPGYVGVKVSLAGDDRGVNDIPLTTGWVFYNPFSSVVYEYPTFTHNAAWTQEEQEGSPNNEEISFTSSDNLTFTADISLAYQLTASKVPHFYVQFRNDDLNTFTHGFLKSEARNAFNSISGEYLAEDIYGGKKEQFLQEVLAKLNSRLDTMGVVITQFGFIGAPRPPVSVVQAINRKIEATQNAQRVQNEVLQAEAEARKQIAIAYGEGAADSVKKALQASANRVLTNSLTPQVLEWEKLQVMRQWNGVMPTTIVGQNTPLMLNMK